VQTLGMLPAGSRKKEIFGLIKMFQTIRNKRISKFISSSWQRFECLGGRSWSVTEESHR